MKKKLDCFGIVFNQPSYLPLNLHSQSKTSCVNAMYSLLEMGNFQPAMLYAMMCYVTTPKTASSPGKVEPQQHPKRPALRRPEACLTGRTLFFRGTKISKDSPHPGTECLGCNESKGRLGSVTFFFEEFSVNS